MKDTAFGHLAGEQYRQELLALISKIESAKDINAASLDLEKYLKNFEVQLMSVKFCDSAESGKTIWPFNSYPEGIARVCNDIQAIGGCPFAKEVVRRMEAFDSCLVDRKKYNTFLDRRFFQEFDKLEHKHIAVVPIMIGRSIAMFTIGLGVEPFKGRMQEIITETIGQIVPAFIDRFPEIKTMFEQKHLSDLERRILILFCEGSEMSAIVREIGLSELTIMHLIQNASRKLKANNSKRLIYVALALGEIPHPNSRVIEAGGSHSLH